MNEKSARAAFHAQVSGRVQGVGFRYTCYTEARRLGLSGWVRNEYNGDVAVWAEGAGEKLDSLLRWLQRGPPGARVDQVRCEKRLPAGCRAFEIKF
ncbi:MAG: acylphosphatase [Treponema sp.]|jgi:acylphosphatase|nr:acylphosphatase [Treponema sp.]